MTSRHLFALTAAAMLAACAGSNGSDGAPGAKGDKGDPGIVTTVTTTTGETCTVCHGSTKLVKTADWHANAFATGTQDDVVISNLAVANAAGKIRITFHVANSAGAITTVANADLRVYVAGFDASVGTGYFNRWLQERTGTGYTFGTLTHNGGGDYTYTTAADLSAAPAGTEIQRVFIRVARTGMNTGNGIKDFNKTDYSAPASNPRDVVPSAACNNCHKARIGDHGHGGGYNKTEACIVCHSPLYTAYDMVTNGFSFAQLIHQVHGEMLTFDADGVTTRNNWSEITYPANMMECTVCHQGGATSDNWRTRPTTLGCTSCHTNGNGLRADPYGKVTMTAVNLNDHPFTGDGPKTDAECATCHTAASIANNHKTLSSVIDPAHATTQIATPEFDVTIGIDPPNNTTFYVAGETPTVTVTLKNHATGADVPSTVYTAAKDATGVSGGGLAVARLYVYGPRTAPKPVLTAGAAVTPVPRQATELFAAGAATDPSVLTTATGFKYQLKPIPAGMTGTYLIRFDGADYGRKSDTNFIASSTALIRIQIGNATVQKKIAGDCTKCHGTAPAPFHDARHAANYDTDECISCHDQSGNHADPLANRVHAVHSSSVTGDLLGDSWAEVVYPVRARMGGVKNCGVCHDSGNAQYLDNAASVSCRGCHADNVPALDHMKQNGGY